MADEIKAAFADCDPARHDLLEDAIRAELTACHDDALTVGHISELMTAAKSGKAAHWQQFDQEVARCEGY